jgi:uncharacterized membrane protein
MSRTRVRINAALQQLEGEGALSREQREKVQGRLDLALKSDAVDFASVVASFGALLVAAGLLYLVGYNWELLSKPGKLSLVFGVWLALHGAGWFLAERPGRHPRLGRALTLAGVLAFGGAIGLVAQIYHLTARYPHAILIWWTLSVPVVLVTRSGAILATVMVLALTWTAWHLGVWLDDRAVHGRFPGYLASYVLVGMSLAALLQGLATLAARGRYRELSEVLRGPVLPLAAVAPFALAFHEPWWDAQRAGVAWPLLAPVAAAGALALAALAWATWLEGARALRNGWILLGLAALQALVVALAPRAVPVLANGILFGGALGLVAMGVAQARRSLATWGIFLFVVGVLARYFEYLWDKLEGAFAFLATGFVLMGAAYFFENRRRAVAARLSQESP